MVRPDKLNPYFSREHEAERVGGGLLQIAKQSRALLGLRMVAQDIEIAKQERALLGIEVKAPIPEAILQPFVTDLEYQRLASMTQVLDPVFDDTSPALACVSVSLYFDTQGLPVSGREISPDGMYREITVVLAQQTTDVTLLKRTFLRGFQETRRPVVVSKHVWERDPLRVPLRLRDLFRYGPDPIPLFPQQ